MPESIAAASAAPADVAVTDVAVTDVAVAVVPGAVVPGAVAQHRTVTERLNSWLNDPAEPLWERPRPTRTEQRNDLYGALALAVVALVALVMSKSMSEAPADESTWEAYAATVVMVAPLAVRRRFPLAVLLLSSALFLGLSYLAPSAAYTISFQVAYFAALYAAVAWAPERRMLWIAMGLVLLTMTLWLVITFTLASGYSDLLPAGVDDLAGPVAPLTAAVVYTSIVNLAYFGGAIAAGRASWRSALQRERLAQQADRIREQSDELARRAVVDERLRIARELHDVVAHHVSVIGVQAGAARTVLTRDPDAASDALRTIESSSRQAVGDMRSLLGVLRSETDTDRPSGPQRAPEPGLADLDELAEVHRAAGLDVVVTVVEGAGPVSAVPGPVSLSLFRTVQESLSNVARHSTARHVRLSVRTGSGPSLAQPTDPATDPAGTAPVHPWVEVEVVDDGHPRSGTAGSGYGLRGIRERVHLHHGEAEIGPRQAGSGWRVRVRLPMTSPTERYHS
ncbi:sensor histidine kinase [Sanguibacter antarcticus]|uniref:histidine kinase n=1 Tax=Sanguibacter antarcticus TaxID=372484 RepID=A0A2A9E812_9MICO|nr:histidine kinase [Sanguibacter antarcticus]PFG34786.1 signal transduction histidine kinase [Sanguibacter antarcticus]